MAGTASSRPVQEAVIRSGAASNERPDRWWRDSTHLSRRAGRSGRSHPAARQTTVPLRNFLTMPPAAMAGLSPVNFGTRDPASSLPTLPSHMPVCRAPGQCVAGLVNNMCAAPI